MTKENSTFHIYLQDDWLAYEIRELVRLFVDHEHIHLSIDPNVQRNTPVQVPGLVCDYGEDDGKGRSWLRLNNQVVEVINHKHWHRHPHFQKQAKRNLLINIYWLMQQWKPTNLPWGTLTGVRPVKLAHQLLKKLGDDGHVIHTLQDEYAINHDKAELITEIAHRQTPILRSVRENSVSLYIGIPLCPSRCSYCSFISQPVSGDEDPLIDAYLEALVTELKGALDWLKQRSWHIDTLYIGGGTPSLLSAQQIQRLMDTLANHWPLDTLREITFEAGRPDTITAEKLAVLKQYPINRLCINPQTMQQETLERINRNHTIDAFREAWHLARGMGFDSLNLDLIVGLPGEASDDVRKTLEAIRFMNPDNITIHALALKRGSTLKESHEKLQISNEQASEMMDSIYRFAQAQNMVPYYLYRQKEMTGNLENVGFTKPGKEGIYNVLMMEEKQTIMGIGAGAVSKLYFPKGDRIQRKPNVKNIHVYIERIQQQGFDAEGWNRLLYGDTENI